MAKRNAPKGRVRRPRPTATVVRPTFAQLTAGMSIGGSTMRPLSARAPSGAPTAMPSLPPGVSIDPTTGKPVLTPTSVLDPSKLVGGVFDKLAPILKITAGGVVMVVSGIALVYVAGRNTGAVKAVKMAANPARAVARKAAPQRTANRAALKTRQSSARANVARKEADSRVKITGNPKTGRERVSKVSAKEGVGIRKGNASARASVKRARIQKLRSRPTSHKVVKV